MILPSCDKCIWVVLTLALSGLVSGDRPSLRRMYRRSEHATLSRFSYPSSLKRYLRHQRSTWSVINQRSYAHAHVKEEETRAKLRIAQQLQIRQRMNHAKAKPWWGQWSSWSACGRTCGSGVQFQERHCLGSRYIPTHQRGQIICEGSTRKYRICSTEPCPPLSPSFRKLQCSQLASQRVRGRYYTWKPYGHPDDEIVSSEPCQIVCISTNGEEQRNTKALDGTECRRAWDFGRCVRGECQFIGCDGKINSTNLRNRCGKCDDENEPSCSVIDEEFSHNFDEPGEIEVARIPQESYDILILGKRRYVSDIVVKDVGGNVLFHSDIGSKEGSQGPRNVLIAGVEFRFRQPETTLHTSSDMYLLTTGSITQDIVVHVATRRRGHAASIHYEFKTPIYQTQKQETTKWTEATSAAKIEVTPTLAPIKILVPSSIVMPTVRTVGPIARIVEPVVRRVIMPLQVPEERSDGQGLDRVHDESFLYIREFEPVPISQETENLSNETGTEDSLDSGDKNPIFTGSKSNGTADEIHKYVPETTGIRNDIAAVESVERRIHQGPEVIESPPESDPTPGRTNVPEDIPERQRSPPSGTQLGDLPELGLPGIYSWRSTGFSPCTSTCTSGLQDTYTHCEKTQTRERVDDRFCDPRTRPEPVRRSCRSKPCQPRWEASPWSQCSKSCGVGEKRRSVRCWKVISPGFDSTIYNELCANISGEKPSETQPCKVRDLCGPLWETSDWSKCHSPCDAFGTKRREVRCSAGDDHMCAATPKPHAVERCKGNRCTMKWIVSDWGECSGMCGGGRKTRTVACFDNENRRYPEFRCDSRIKPETFHPCGDRNCRPDWITQEWDECSTECGDGIKKRVVLCSGIIDGQVHHYEDSSPCNATAKPPDAASCRVKECDPVWLSSPWSRCSVTCGSGRLSRQVNCYRNGALTTGCDVSLKPVDSAPCNGPPCPKATAGLCKNKASVNCVLVQRVNLCSHWFYQKACCASCRALGRGG